MISPALSSQWTQWDDQKAVKTSGARLLISSAGWPTDLSLGETKDSFETFPYYIDPERKQSQNVREFSFRVENTSSKINFGCK